MWSPQDSNMWKLDRWLVRLGILCGPCGLFKWDKPCYASHHWHPDCCCKGCTSDFIA